MATEVSGFADALERVRAALADMGSGDLEPSIRCWAESEDALLFGAWGPVEKGRGQLAETFRWVGSRFQSGQRVPENAAVFARRGDHRPGNPGRSCGSDCRSAPGADAVLTSQASCLSLVIRHYV